MRKFKLMVIMLALAVAAGIAVRAEDGGGSQLRLTPDVRTPPLKDTIGAGDVCTKFTVPFSDIHENPGLTILPTTEVRENQWSLLASGGDLRMSSGLKTMELALNTSDATAVAAGASVSATDSGWQFMLSPYGWVASLKGTVGIADVRTDVDVPFSDILKKLELAGMLRGEVRKNRWGLLVDGIYMKLYADMQTPGPFFNTISPTIEMSVLDMALAYRVVEGDRGWVDLLVGARYIDISGKLDMQPNYAGVDGISRTVLDTVTQTVGAQVQQAAGAKAGQIANELASVVGDVGAAAKQKIQSEVQIKATDTAVLINQKIDQIMDQVASIPPRKLDQIKKVIQSKLDSITEAQREALADAAQQKINAAANTINATVNTAKGKAQAIQQQILNAVAEKAAALQQTASAKAQQAYNKALQDLSTAITQGMTTLATANVEASRDWVDPYVGMRARLNLTQRFYLGARGDIGGFGVGSDLTWQLFGGAGVHLSKSIDLEAGYRYLTFDYNKDNLLLNVAFSGFIVGATVNF